jgi:hypothetical protein
MKSIRSLMLLIIAIGCLTTSFSAAAQTSSLARDRLEILNRFQSVYIETRTKYFQPEALQRELYKQRAINAWGIVIVDDPDVADLRIVVDRPALTFDYTFKIVDQRSRIVLGAGKIIAIDGIRAAPGLAAQIVTRIKVARPLPTGEKAQLENPPITRSAPTLIRRESIN